MTNHIKIKKGKNVYSGEYKIEENRWNGMFGDNK